MTVRLRPLEPADLRRIYDWQRDPALYEHLVGDRRVVDWDEAYAWMTRHWLAQGPDHRFALCVGDEGRMVGCVYLLAVEGSPGTFEFHIFIGAPQDRRRGWGRAALDAALRIAFDDLDARSVRLRVLESNAVARRIYQDAGFLDKERGRTLVEKASGPVPVIALSLDRPNYLARNAGK